MVVAFIVVIVAESAVIELTARDPIVDLAD